MNEKDFSLEESEKLIANIRSGAPSEFEQLRSTLSLLAHVPEISPVSAPPVLPSNIAQPTPITSAKSIKPRRTIVTSVIVMAMFGSASLAAAAVTGIGPSPIVNIGHQTAKIVKSFAGAVTKAVTGGSVASPTPYATASTAPEPVVATTQPQIENQNSLTSSNGQTDSSSQLIPPVASLVSPESKNSDNEKFSSNKENTSNENPSGQIKPQEKKESQPSKTESPRPVPALTLPPAHGDDGEESSKSVPNLTMPPAPSDDGEESHSTVTLPIPPQPSGTVAPTGIPSPIPFSGSDDSESDD